MLSWVLDRVESEGRYLLAILLSTPILYMNENLNLDQMIEAVAVLVDEPQLLQLYRQGDRVSRSQTKHDVGHALSVMETACRLQKEIGLRFPQLLSQCSREVIIPAGAFFHDIGRAVEVNNHAEAGKTIALDFLTNKGFPRAVASKVAAIVSCHRSEDFLRMTPAAIKKFPELAIVVIADKCVGDENRVRFWRAIVLSFLSRLGLANIDLWPNSQHDRVNFAVKDSVLLVDSDDYPSPDHAGAMILKLKMDESVATGVELLSLYSKRFQACVLAANALGFAFRVEVNASRYYFDQNSREWLLKGTHAILLP